MSKATQRAIEFAKNPPLFVTFTPIDYMIYETEQKRDGEYVKDGWPWLVCDPMEKNDPAILVMERWAWTLGEGTKRWTVWLAVRCIQAGDKRKFGVMRDGAVVQQWSFVRAGLRGFTLWRVPYRWRPAVAKLEGQEFESREELEAAMRATEELQ